MSVCAVDTLLSLPLLSLLPDAVPAEEVQHPWRASPVPRSWGCVWLGGKQPTPSITTPVACSYTWMEGKAV